MKCLRETRDYLISFGFEVAAYYIDNASLIRSSYFRLRCYHFRVPAPIAQCETEH